MKKKLSVSIEEDVLDLIESKLNSCYFRNKSHFVEMALREFMEK